MRFTLKQFIKWFAWFAFAGIIILYAFYGSHALRMGPVIILETPENGETFTSPLIHVRGTATQAKELVLDGRGIFIDLKGRFDEQLLLLPGYNIIELTAKDAGGHSTRKLLEVTFLGNSPEVPPNSSSTQSAASTTVNVIHSY